MVTGSLLGLMTGSILEVTHAFPFPDQRPATLSNSDKDTEPEDQGISALDGHEFQLEMMRMLREVKVDNNCVGWYQSMYLGLYSTSSLLENQLSYQEDLSPNAVVILYDPMQTSHGNLVLKCYRLSDHCVRIRQSGSNEFINPREIFEEVPITLTNPGLVQALLMDLTDGVYDSPADTSFTRSVEPERTLSSAALNEIAFDQLDLSTNPYLEKHLEFLSGWVDELATEQQKFQYYARQLAREVRGAKKSRAISHEDAWASSDAPRRMESLLIGNQIRSYCEQMNQFTSGSLGKLYLLGGLHKNQSSTPSAK